MENVNPIVNDENAKRKYNQVCEAVADVNRQRRFLDIEGKVWPEVSLISFKEKGEEHPASTIEQIEARLGELRAQRARYDVEIAEDKGKELNEVKAKCFRLAGKLGLKIGFRPDMPAGLILGQHADLQRQLDDRDRQKRHETDAKRAMLMKVDVYREQVGEARVEAGFPGDMVALTPDSKVSMANDLKQIEDRATELKAERDTVRNLRRGVARTA